MSSGVGLFPAEPLASLCPVVREPTPSETSADRISRIYTCPSGKVHVAPQIPPTTPEPSGPVSRGDLLGTDLSRVERS